MYVTALDTPWYKSPFLRHRFHIRSQSQIDKLRRFAIREVTVDPSKGLDVEVSAAVPTLAAENGSFRSRYSIAAETHKRLTESVQSSFEAAVDSGSLDDQAAHNAARELVIVSRSIDANAFLLAIGDPSLEFTAAEHAVSVASLALLLGHALDYDFTRLHHLGTAAIVHDLGLLQIPPAVRKPHTTLQGADRQLYESHPTLAVSTLEQKGTFDSDVIRMVAEHHVRPDHTGFPHHYAWDATTEGSRILAVADRYHEVLKDSPERVILPHIALSRLYREATERRLDARIVFRFIQLVGIYPLCTPIELNTGERGFVSDLSSNNMLGPTVMLTHDAQSRPYDRPVKVDLSAQRAPRGERSITRTLEEYEGGLRFHDALKAIEGPS